MTTEPLTRLVHNLSRALATDALADADLLDRFRAARDPAAFEAIVRRHGPRVLAACRKVLPDPADAEDAFQATFVILMRDPRAVRRAAALGPWLFGVAHRVALQARIARQRRERIEARAAGPRADVPDLSWAEACAILHEELDRLPDTHRLPLLLCYLDGLTRDEAAHTLGRTLGSVKRSLEVGRDRLRRRLSRRGIALSAGLLAAVAEPAGAGPSPVLVRTTVAGAASPTPAVATLAAGGGRGGFRVRAAGAFLAASILAVGGALGLPRDPQSDPPARDAPAAKSAPAARGEMIQYAGTVTGPDGKPVKGANLWLFLDGSGTAPLRAGGETGADGTFAFEIKRSELPARCYYENGRDLWSAGTVLAVAPGLPVGWAAASGTARDKTPVRIPAEAPVEGTIKNLEGQPVAGVTVRVVGLYFPKGGDLADFAEDVKAGKLDQSLIYQHLGAFEGDDLRDGALNPVFPPVRTAKDGTFTLKGLGRERAALLRIEGDGIETEDVMVMTRPADSVLAKVPKERNLAMPVTLQGRYTVHGSKFAHTAAPSRPVVGVVRDLDTGKPVPGAMIRLASQGEAWRPLKERIWVKADAAGRYRFAGLPLRAGCELRVEGPADLPYLAAGAEVPKPAGVGPVTVDVKLKRGVWALVRVFDKTDNASVAAEIEYFARPDNPHLKDVPPLRFTRFRRMKVDDETIRVPVLPGPGILAARISWQHRYVSLTSPRAAPIPALPPPFRAQEYLGHTRIDPPADSKGEKVEIGLTRGLEE